MITYLRPTSGLAIACALALLSIPKTAAAAAKAVPAKTFEVRLIPEAPIPSSVFAIPSQPSEGRNPFFPQSVPQVAVQKVTKETPMDAAWFVLNGITSPPRRTAMINGRTFEPGEEGEVRLPTGAKLLIKCEEIKTQSAIISTGGQRRELRLRSGL